MARPTVPRSQIGVQNGWLVCDRRPLIGLGHANDGWGGLRKSHTPPERIKPFREWVFQLQPRVNVCRHWPGRTGPGQTEDLEQVAEVYPEPQKYHVRACLRFWRQLDPPLVEVVRRRYRAKRPGKFAAEAAKAWRQLPEATA